MKHIHKSIDHWQRMIDYVKENCKLNYVVDRDQMDYELGESWTSKDCALCIKHEDYCPDCELSKIGQGCTTTDSAYYKVANSETWGEWLTNAYKMLDVLKSLLKEKPMKLRKWNELTDGEKETLIKQMQLQNYNDAHDLSIVFASIEFATKQKTKTYIKDMPFVLRWLADNYKRHDSYGIHLKNMVKSCNGEGEAFIIYEMLQHCGQELTPKLKEKWNWPLDILEER
jgi:hypothetical protein